MNFLIFFIKQVFGGKTIYRLIFNWYVKKYSKLVHGDVLDLAGGEKTSYDVFFQKEINLIKTDLLLAKDKIVDFNKIFPYADNSFNCVLFFNAIYIARDPLFTMKEIYRVLKKDGIILLSSPFISNIMPEPQDFRRLTNEGLLSLFREAGFTDFNIYPFGGSFTSSIYIINQMIPTSFLRFLTYANSLFLDKLFFKILGFKNTAPLGFLCLIKKK
jgi:SAM-dependent methyltransferase